MVKLLNIQVRSKPQVLALLLELGFFLHSAQQITREFAKMREHSLAKHSENWSKRCYPKAKLKPCNNNLVMDINIDRLYKEQQTHLSDILHINYL